MPQEGIEVRPAKGLRTGETRLHPTSQAEVDPPQIAQCFWERRNGELSLGFGDPRGIALLFGSFETTPKPGLSGLAVAVGLGEEEVTLGVCRQFFAERFVKDFSSNRKVLAWS